MAKKTTDKNLDMSVNKAGNNLESPNVTGSGETSRTANDDIGNPNADVQDPHRARETGRADTDMDADTMGGDLSSDH